ncbi:MAG: anhydro-N-acetylmuramic acid kinase [Chitinophagaceae bacterium]|nr:anhydro-N-acetylmuramic acid kinase [Chitinophagaceae bacterium]
MIYRTIGLMSGSSLDGLDIAFVEFQENGGKWQYEILHADCYAYPDEWIKKLTDAIHLNALDYQLLHAEYGHYLGEQVNRFIEKNELQYKVALIASHGHTSFHVPSKRMTAQLGDGAAIAAETQLPVVSDLRALDVALGGQGAPIVPIGERLLLGDYAYFLNLGGIANISWKPATESREGTTAREYVAFDICAANRVLNLLSNEKGLEYDKDGAMASAGKLNKGLLEKLDALDYYKQPYPKSLANDFGTDIVYPMIKEVGIKTEDAIHTYCVHVAKQIREAIIVGLKQDPSDSAGKPSQLLATGGGAFNTFLIDQLRQHLKELKIEVVVPDARLVNYKEALVMALIGVLRWREKENVFASVTGASRNSVGGALWMGQEA